KEGDIGVIHYTNPDGRKNTALVFVQDVKEESNDNASTIEEEFFNSGIFSTGSSAEKTPKAIKVSASIILGDWNPKSEYAFGKVVEVDHVDVCLETSFEAY